MSDEISPSWNLLDPRVWDDLKDQLSDETKQNFLAVHSLTVNDELSACRKAEFHIMLGSEEDDQIAFELLSNYKSPLALGLLAKLYSAQENKTKLEDLLKHSFPSCESIHDFEGAIHFRRAQARLAYLKGNFETALISTYYAQSLAIHLGLSYLQKVIQSDLNDISRQLGTPAKLNQTTTGNPRLKQHHSHLSFKTLLINGQYEDIEKLALAERYLNLAKALEAKQQARYSYALLQASKLSFQEEEFQFHTALLKLELFGRTQDYVYTQPKGCLRLIHKLLPKLEGRIEIIRDCAKLYPLGVSMAELDAEVAILKDNGYRDGFHYEGKVYVIPNKARKLLIQGDLENQHQTGLLTKAERYRMNSKLRAAGLNTHHLVSEALIEKAIAQLSKIS